MKQTLLLGVLFIGVIAASHAGKIYKWIDENGQTHYSTFPPAQAETEKVRVPASTQSSRENSGSTRDNYKKSYSDKRSSRKHEERKRIKEEHKKKQAIKNYDRKYGPEAKLKRLEREKQQKEARADKIYQQRIHRIEQEKKAKEFDQKWEKYKQKALGMEAECKAAHGTDCTNPEYLNKWVKKKYEKKK